jgi:hypothetical protein
VTYEEGVAWLSAVGGGLKKHKRDEVVSVMAFAHNLAATVTPKDLADTADVRRCELEAIEDLKQIVDP